MTNYPLPPENPFADYKPPAVDEILEPAFKAAILNNKFGRLSEDLRQLMLVDGVASQFTNRNVALGFDYPCAGLAFLCGIDLDVPDLTPACAEITAMLERPLDQGVQRGLTEAGFEGRPKLNIVGHFKEDDPTVLAVIIESEDTDYDAGEAY